MSGRKSLSKTTRFEVFKRDSFTCQYCGRKAPDVVLEIEHIHPVARGGDNDILNLVTSCESCNDGKGARLLDDASAVERSRRQVESLQDRREQIEMMLAWKEGLRDLDEHIVGRIWEYIVGFMPGFTLNPSGAQTLKKWVATYSIEELTAAVDISMRQYLKIGDDGRPTSESAGKAWEYIGRIAKVRRAEVKDPGLRDLFYARGIARRRCNYFDDVTALELLRRAYDLGADAEELKNIARGCSSWSSFRHDMYELISALEKEVAR